MKYLLVALFGVLLLVSPASSGPEKTKFVVGDEILADLPGVRVHIEGVRNDARKIGVTKDAIRRKVELVLRQSGIPVLTSKEHEIAPGSPMLYVKVRLAETAFIVYVEFQEVVTLIRRSVRTPAMTWHKVVAGAHRGEGKFVLRGVTNGAEVFALAWLKQNPIK